jgi:carboxymethylenebutenolidase
MNFPYQAMLAETVTFKGHNGDLGEAYFARPLGPGPSPGVVIIHHMPGWDEWIKEVPRKLAYHGFLGIARTSIFAKAPAIPTTSGRAYAPSGAYPTNR